MKLMLAGIYVECCWHHSATKQHCQRYTAYIGVILYMRILSKHSKKSRKNSFDTLREIRSVCHQ